MHTMTESAECILTDHVNMPLDIVPCSRCANSRDDDVTLYTRHCRLPAAVLHNIAHSSAVQSQARLGKNHSLHAAEDRLSQQIDVEPVHLLDHLGVAKAAVAYLHVVFKASQQTLQCWVVVHAGRSAQQVAQRQL